MPRQSDIHAAFVAAIQLNPKDYRCLRMDGFVSPLVTVNWDRSLKGG